MVSLISIIFLVAGVIFIMVGAIGIVRMPDVFLRMSASTKTTIIGSGLMLIGVIIFFRDVGVTGRALAIFVFTLSTAPVSAHMIGRASFSDGVSLWSKTRVNDLQGKYDEETGYLSSGEFGEPKDPDAWQTTSFIDDHGV